MSTRKFPYHQVGREDGSAYLTVFLPGRNPLTVADDHPNYKDLLSELQCGGTTVNILEELADISIAVAKRFRNLSERVAVADGQVYFDGDVVDGTISDIIVRALDEQSDDWRPLVAFMENVAANPEEHSRVQLYDWLRAHSLTITFDGMIVGHKGVRITGTPGLYESRQSGHAIVNGDEVNGHVPQRVGDIVEMPRSAVAHDPAASCSTGLHVGTFDYAGRWAGSGGALLTVAVNPRDVVSVPTDAGGEKVRVSRYLVIAVDEEAPTQMFREAQDASVYPWETGSDELPECPECGEYLDTITEDCPNECGQAEVEECEWCSLPATTTDADGDPACSDHEGNSLYGD